MEHVIRRFCAVLSHLELSDAMNLQQELLPANEDGLKRRNRIAIGLARFVLGGLVLNHIAFCLVSLIEAPTVPPVGELNYRLVVWLWMIVLSIFMLMTLVPRCGKLMLRGGCLTAFFLTGAINASNHLSANQDRTAWAFASTLSSVVLAVVVLLPTYLIFSERIEKPSQLS